MNTFQWSRLILENKLYSVFMMGHKITPIDSKNNFQKVWRMKVEVKEKDMISRWKWKLEMKKLYLDDSEYII